MTKSIQLAAILLSGAVFMGCDDKKDATTTPPSTPSTSTMTTPSMPDTSSKMNQMNNAIDKGSTSVKNEADKMLNGAPTTMPAIPGMGK